MSRKALCPEGAVLARCKAALEAHGIQVRRRNVSKVPFRDRHGVDRWVQLNHPGESDLTGTIPPFGTRLELEVKAPGEKPTEDQLQWLEQINYYGGVAFWCDSDEYLIKVIPWLKAGWKVEIDPDTLEPEWYRLNPEVPAHARD